MCDILPRHILALMHAPTDAIITVRPEGRVRIVRRHEAAGDTVVYSQARLLAEGVVFTPAALEELARRLTAGVRRRGKASLVA
ncbi:hypothetical protein ACQEU5_20555 [Marinactinospora thermotolerans]|uniref:Uncharacterized protein n=1 Tax=Marinactinospora thermotolerans DSM 45154 TaxID=1122192 RepID=A0A1T4PS73_9ACTN|nr:hypothetical protein [Marinactinospora thermotolerans]SJZ94106.1 hypothetical protein SAMN02745673_01958 [Marinactinospora thermotolerans DSM 45154]